MTILHLVPRLGPEIDGVGDFAVALGERLRERYGTENLFLSGDPHQVPPDRGHCLSERSAEALGRAVRGLDFDLLLLHYSGYGYDRRGVPNWLSRGMCAAAGQRPVGVFFHELWVTSPPWRTPFYFAGAQRRIVRELQTSASFCVTSTPRTKRWLDEAGGHSILSPIPSPFEPAPRRENRSESLNVVIFGQEHTRDRSIGAHARLLRKLHSSGRLASLKLMGRGANSLSRDHRKAAEIASGRVTSLPDLTLEEIRREWARADLGPSFYPLTFLTKSTTAMAALSSGCPVVLPPEVRPEPFDPAPPVIISAGESLEPFTRERLNAAALASREWYERHASWDRMLERVAPALQRIQLPVGQSA